MNVFATAWIAFAVARASNRPSAHIARAVSTSAAYVSELARRFSRPRSPRASASAPASPPPSRVSRAIFTSAVATCTRSSDARRVALPEQPEGPDATVAARARTCTSSSRELSERRTFSSSASRVIISFAFVFFSRSAASTSSSPSSLSARKTPRTEVCSRIRLVSSAAPRAAPTAPLPSLSRLGAAPAPSRCAPLPNPGNSAATHLRKLTSSLVPSTRVSSKYLYPLVSCARTRMRDTPPPTFLRASGWRESACRIRRASRAGTSDSSGVRSSTSAKRSMSARGLSKVTHADGSPVSLSGERATPSSSTSPSVTGRHAVASAGRPPTRPRFGTSGRPPRLGASRRVAPEASPRARGGVANTRAAAVTIFGRASAARQDARRA